MITMPPSESGLVPRNVSSGTTSSFPINTSSTTPASHSFSPSSSSSQLSNSTFMNIMSAKTSDRDHDRTLTSTTTLVVTMTIPLGTASSGTVEWSTMVQTSLTVQLVLPSDLNLHTGQGSNNSATIGIIFGAISLVLIFLAGMFVILRRHFKKKYSEDRLNRFQKFARQAGGVGPYDTTAAQAGSISHSHRQDLESSEDLSEETAVTSPIMEYREGRRSPVEVPQLYTDGNSVSTASSFITVSSVPVPFYERIKEARRAGIRKYTM